MLNSVTKKRNPKVNDVWRYVEHISTPDEQCVDILLTRINHDAGCESRTAFYGTVIATTSVKLWPLHHVYSGCIIDDRWTFLYSRGGSIYDILAQELNRE